MQTYAAADPAFGLARPGDSLKVADMRCKIGKGLEISDDGATVRLGLDCLEDKPVWFDVAASSLVDSPGEPVGPRARPYRRPAGDGPARQL